jgi:peroxiredoxin
MTVDVGDPAPDFVLRDQNNQEVPLASYRTSKAVLLVFYPLAFTGTCQGELSGVQTALEDFQNEKVQILTVSVDSPYAHKVWADREGYTFPMLSDFWPHGAVAAAYGVLNEARGYADRGTFLIDPDGVIAFAERAPASQPRDPSIWRAAITAL